MNHMIIVLGGNNPNNKDWASQLAEGFSKFGEPHLQIYGHWKTGGSDIDFEAELVELTNFLENCGGTYSIVCKSAGALLALQGINQGSLAPDYLVCIGLPLEYADYRGLQLDKLVSKNKIPTLYIQAIDDPAGKADAVSAIVADHGIFSEIPGKDHNYSDLDQITTIASDFILAL